MPRSSLVNHSSIASHAIMLAWSLRQKRLISSSDTVGKERLISNFESLESANTRILTTASASACKCKGGRFIVERVFFTNTELACLLSGYFAGTFVVAMGCKME